MNLNDLHSMDKPVSAVSIFKNDGYGTAISIHIRKGEQLTEHITKTPACLVCMAGHALFENEKGEKHDLKSGDYVSIEPMVKHWVDGLESSQLILVK
jgi:quercetin dioxygenase-like cupin family protein